MANPIARAMAVIRQRPALALAVGGVGVAAAVSVGRRRAEDPAPPPEAVATSTAQPIAGYGPGLSAASPLDAVLGDPYAGERASATATITSAINAGNAGIIDAIRQAIAAGQRGTVTPLPPVKVAPKPVTPAPVKQPTPAPKPVTPAPAVLTPAQAAAAIAAIGGVGSWATSGAWIRAGATDPKAPSRYVWASTASMQAWARRIVRNGEKPGYRVDANGRIVRA